MGPDSSSDVSAITVHNADPNTSSDWQAQDDATLLPLKKGNWKKKCSDK